MAWRQGVDLRQAAARHQAQPDVDRRPQAGEQIRQVLTTRRRGRFDLHEFLGGVGVALAEPALAWHDRPAGAAVAPASGDGKVGRYELTTARTRDGPECPKRRLGRTRGNARNRLVRIEECRQPRAQSRRGTERFSRGRQRHPRPVGENPVPVLGEPSRGTADRKRMQPGRGACLGISVGIWRADRG
jgi:hypothetical protein